MHQSLISGKTSCARFLLIAACLLFVPLGHAAGRYVFISHAPDSDTWWTTIKNSLKHAAEDFGVTVDYKNPKNGDIKDMARIIDEAAAEKYDGMIVTIADYDQLKSHLQAVIKKGQMRLVTVNSGTEEQSESIGALLHVGQPEHYAGLNAGRKAKTAGITTFTCLNHYATNRASHERCQGFAEGLGVQKFDELELSGSDQAMQARIGDYLTAHKDTEAILALGPTSAHAALAAIRDGKAAKPLYFATFDLSGQISEAIHKGLITFAIDQQPYLQGYLSVGLLSRLAAEDNQNLTMTKAIVYSNTKLHSRAATYGLSLLSFGGRHIRSGPALVTKSTIDKVDMYSGTYR